MPGSPGRFQKVDVGIMDVCYYGGSVILHVVGSYQATHFKYIQSTAYQLYSSIKFK